ncbi:uncharacterized protein J7T54_002876 [Emericellopsis cladophorae]|uniref:Uncharacterized protein n=1 Tax=Emericellopsis cladophorae TaxID=2686198 RepID=A0A9P9XU06_9HYPO|nr:uncharacterized protein J7T54_002876 [Emericellopsis cladophorae]KAI6777774.1 hypothetical protein J7T54_002876 [Emericellopsis cladophorae]
MHLETLLAKIMAHAPTEIDLYLPLGEERVAARLRDLLFLDQLSDPALLGGKSSADVWQVRMRRTGPEIKGGVETTWPDPRLFLLADTEVLEALNRYPFFWVRCVDAEHDEETEKSLTRNSRVRSSVVDGWFRMTTRSIVDLCQELRHCDGGSLTPQVWRWEDALLYNGKLTGSNLASAVSSGK